MFDKGSGPAIIVIPGLQGRWEWMRPPLRALTQYGRVISYSLDDARTFEDLLSQLDGIFERTGLPSAALCGVSFGGRVAAVYAATRPARVTALIIASSPGPSFVPNERQTRYELPWERVQGEVEVELIPIDTALRIPLPRADIS